MDFIRKVLLATPPIHVLSRSYSTYGSQNLKGKTFKKYALFPTPIPFDRDTLDFRSLSPPAELTTKVFGQAQMNRIRRLGARAYASCGSKGGPRSTSASSVDEARIET